MLWNTQGADKVEQSQQSQIYIRLERDLDVSVK